MAQKRTLYYPQNLELLFPGILHNATTLGHYGVGLSGRLSYKESDSPAFAVTGAFPLGARKQETRNSGWAWGFAAGASEKIHVNNEVVSPSLYFWELMLGRGSNSSDLNNNTGLLGFLELSFKDERPNNRRKQQLLLETIGRSIEQHRYSLNLRMGSSFSPLGEGLVVQKPGKFSSSLFLHVSMPIGNNEWRASGTVQGIYHCFSRILCIWESGVLGSIDKNRKNRDPSKDITTDDLRTAYFTGPRIEYRRTRHLFAVNFRWKLLQGAREVYFQPYPALLLHYQGAF